MWGFTWHELAVQAEGHLVLTGEYPEPKGACLDTRCLAKGDLFFALPGEHTDGHQFLLEAQKKGAAGAVVARRPLEFPELTLPLIVVHDPAQALSRLATAQRQLFRGPLIAITGSTGKTTTKEMMATLLEEKGPVLKTPGNYNNELGVPLTLLGLQPEHKFVILELGMRALGEIDFLAQICQPDYGVITNLGHTHEELLGSPQKIAQAKAELLAHLPAEGGLVLPFQAKKMLEPWLAQVICPLYWFGGEAEADFSAKEITVRGKKGLTFTLFSQGVKQGKIKLSFPGKHNVLNALAAIALGKHLGFSLAELQKGLAGAKPAQMRLEFMAGVGDICVINDAYNANPDSMLAALQVLKEVAQGQRTIGVLGEMYELGNYTEEGHLLVGLAVARQDLAYLVTVGKLGEIIAKGAQQAGLPRERIFVCADKAAALFHLEKIKRPGDHILVKGSRGLKMEEIVAGLL